MSQIRTDLAAELYGEKLKSYAEENRGKPDGIKETEKDAGDGITVSEIEIENEHGASLLGKPVGKYITVSFPTARDMDFAMLKNTADAVAEEIRLLLCELSEKPESLLFCGLGNRLLSADAVGPAAFDRVIATRHLKLSNPEVFDKASLFDVSSVSPGVTAQTGIEACNIIKSVIASEKPDLVIVADALAAKSKERLARTVQISNTGISPGAGMGNYRKELSRQSLGTEVIAIGVPTVIDADRLLKNKNVDMVVTPSDIDTVIDVFSNIISSAINICLHPGIYS